MVALLGTAFGDDPDKLAKVSDTLDTLRPVWMGGIENGQRMQFFAAALPGRDPGRKMVLNLIAAAIDNLNELLFVLPTKGRAGNGIRRLSDFQRRKPSRRVRHLTRHDRMRKTFMEMLAIPFLADGSTLYPVPGTGRGHIPDESDYTR
jgi:hypothetical protein